MKENKVKFVLYSRTAGSTESVPMLSLFRCLKILNTKKKKTEMCVSKIYYQDMPLEGTRDYDIHSVSMLALKNLLEFP